MPAVCDVVVGLRVIVPGCIAADAAELPQGSLNIEPVGAPAGAVKSVGGLSAVIGPVTTDPAPRAGVGWKDNPPPPGRASSIPCPVMGGGAPNDNVPNTPPPDGAVNALAFWNAGVGGGTLRHSHPTQTAQNPGQTSLTSGSLCW